MTPRLATAALAATLALAAPQARAATILTYGYSTSGSIASPYNSPITFSGYYHGYNGSSLSLTTPGPFLLGQFTTSPLPTTATLTYDHTPFSVDLQVASLPNGYSSSYVPYYDYKISGELNGSITGAGSSTMLATVTSITPGSNGSNLTPPFPIEDIRVFVPQGIAAPNGGSYGTTTLAARVVLPDDFPLPKPAPEPTSIAAFAAALAGWAIRRRSRSRPGA